MNVTLNDFFAVFCKPPSILRENPLTQKVENFFTFVYFQIRGTGTRNTCIDAVDSAVSNWMRYVNCSRTDAETNLSAFQYKGQIYYKTDSAISRSV